jgi:hypothetical protein
MFIRTRKTNRKYGEQSEHHQALESYRDKNGKPKHRVIAAWTGERDLDKAIADYQDWLDCYNKHLANDEAQLQQTSFPRWRSRYVVKEEAKRWRRRIKTLRKELALMKRASRRQKRGKPCNAIQPTTQPTNTNYQ